MTEGPELAGPPAPPSPRSAKRQTDVRHRWRALLAVVGAIAGRLLLRDAPGRPCGSRSVRPTATISRWSRRWRRLSAPESQPDPSAPDADRRRQSRARRRWPRARPISPSSAAISKFPRMRRPWRRCARTSPCCGCRRQPKGQGQEGGAENHQGRPTRRTSHRRHRPHPGQRQSAEGDSAAIWRRPGQGRRSSSSRPTRPWKRSATRRRTPISPPVPSTARSPRTPSRPRPARAAARPS